MGNRILYYSTNNKLKHGFKKEVTFKQALFIGQAPDNGLFMPNKIPKLSRKEIEGLRNKPYNEVAYFILSKFLKDDIDDKVLRSIIKDAYDLEIPIENFDDISYIVRLDRGPTASFKDFAARFMARIMEVLKPANENINILVAT